MANYKSWKDVARQQGISLKEDKILDYKLPTTAYKNKYEEKTTQTFGQGSTELPAVKKYEEKKSSWQDIARKQGMDVPDPVEEEKEYNHWKEDPLKSAGRNFVAGVKDDYYGSAAILDMLTGGKNEAINNDIQRTYDKKRQQEFKLQDINNDSNIGEIAGAVFRAGGQSLPASIVALLGANSVASKNPLLDKTGTRLATGAGVAGATLPIIAKQALLNGIKNPNTIASGANIIGNQFIQAREEGATRSDATKAALISGIPSTLIETSGGLENMDLSQRQSILRMLIDSAKEEGLEEVAQYPVENMGQKITYDKDMPLFSTKETAVINPGEMAKAGFVGGLAGGLMGGGTAAINSTINKKQSKAINQEYEKTISTLPEDSPIMERVNEFKNNNVKVTDEAKIWVINQARKQQNNFTSETDSLMRNTEATAEEQQKDNKPIEQTFKSSETFAKTQNNVSPTVQRILTNFGIVNIKNAREVKQNIYNFYKDSIISDSNTSKPIMNKDTGLQIEVSHATINQTFQVDEKYAQAADNDIKVAAMANIVDLIQNGTVEVVDKSETPSSKTTYANLTGTITVDSVPYSITLDVRRTDNGSKYFVHSLHTEVQETINKPSGIINNGVQNIVKQNDSVTYDILDRIGQATGIKIRFVQSIDSPDGTRTDIANGQYDPSTKTLDLSMKSENPLLVVAKHEITHMLQQQSPKLYREYKIFVISTMQEASKEGYEARFNSIKSLHERAGLEISRSAIEDEIVADATELFLTNENAINALAKENSTLGQKILDIIRDFLKKVDDAIQGATSKLMNVEQLRKAEQLWVNALNDVIENKQGNVAEGEAAVAAEQYSIKADNIGYHAGDLGKADYLNIMPGRGTGHFGTGTYFVGNEKDIDFANYKDRPRHTVSFEGYNLYKPKTTEEGRNLHKFLKNINDMSFLSGYEDVIDDIINGKVDDEYIDNLISTKFPYNSEFELNIDYSDIDDTNDIEKMLKQIEKRISETYIPPEVEERRKEIERYQTFLNKLIDNIDNVRKGLKEQFNFSDNQINKTIKELYNYGTKNIKSTKMDSPSTVFMKSLGYEGVDVRGLNGLDDTEFGSVIYDVDKASVRFSLKEPIEETKDLIALHSLTESKLKGVLELGGFPVPSIAITKADYEHDKFGEISVVFSKDTIDPEFFRSNQVYTQDVYSKRVPRIKNKQKYSQFEKINDIFTPYFEQLEQSIRSYSNKWQDVSIEDAIDELSRQAAAKMAYLDSKGIKTKIEYKNKNLYRFMFEETIKDFWKKYKNIDPVELTNEKEKWNDAVREALIQDRKLLEEKTGKKRDVPPEKLGWGVYDGAVRDILKRPNGKPEKEIDIDKTKDAVNKKVNPKMKDFEKWLRDTISPYFGEKYFENDNGNKRPYTLEDLTEYMRSGNTKNKEKTLVYGMGQVIASTGKELKSISEIKAASKQLVNSEERAKYKKELETFDEAVRGKITKKRINSSESFFDVFEDYYKALTQFLEGKNSAKGSLSKNGFTNVTEEMLNDFREVAKRIKETPAEYFEAKPQRAVGLDEIAAVVAPKTTDKELLQQLKDKSVKVVKYDESIEGDRLRAVNSIKNVKFSLKDSSGNTLTQQQAEYFKDSKVRDKNGNLLVMYHGTDKDFTVFNSGSHFGTFRQSNGIGNKLHAVYLNIKDPAETIDYGDNWESDIEYAKENGNDGVVYLNRYEGVIDRKTGKPITDDDIDNMHEYDSLEDEEFLELYDAEYSYIPLSPEQIKSINNLNPTSDEDIRYQLKDTRDSKEVERLKKINENLKEQFTLTKGVKLDKNAIKKLSRSLIKDYNSKYDRAQLETRMIELYAKIANNQIEYEDMEAETKAMARDIIENASVLNDTMHKQYSELRNTLRNTPITIAERYQKDFDIVGGFKAFKKRNLSRIKLSDEGTEVDQLYQELIELYPELFNADVANPADQLMLIEDVLSGLVPIYENPFNQDINEAVEYLAVEIFEDFTSVPEARATFADRKKAELDKTKADNKEKIKVIKEKNKADIDWIKYQNKEKISQVLDNEKAKRDKEVDKLKKRYSGEEYKTWWKNKLKENDIKSHYQEMMAELRTEKNEKIEQTAARYKERISGIYESRKMRETKASIGRKVKRLDAMLRKPSEKKHISKVLEKSIAELLQQINFETDNQKEATILKLRDLRAEYEKIAKVSDEEGIQATADPYIMEALEMLNNKRLTDMNLEELEILNNIVGYFEHMVQGYNKAFLNGKWQDISDKAQGILMDLRTDTPHTESAYGAVNSFKDMMKWGMLTPQMYFERMGDTFYSMYNDFRDALDVKISNTKVAQDYMQELLKNSKGSIKEWTGSKTKATEFSVVGGTIELTPSQVMSLYMLLKREQARGHIFGLGIKASPIEYKKDGKGVKRIKKQFEPVKIVPEDAVKIISTLSKEQRRIAEGIGKFLNTQSKQWVNEATLKNYGYELAKEENYFPIKTDRDFLKSDFDNTNLDPTFTSMGFLKSTVKGAGNAIIIEDIFDVYTEHADKSATYNAFLTVTESTKKIINFKTKQESIKQSMSRKYGNEAFLYLKKFMVDLQGGLRVEGGPPIVNQLIRNTKRTVLGLNMRTIVQQPTAIIRASALIDIDYLMKGIAMKSDKEEMLSHSPIALWKSWGYFNLDTGRTMKDIILDSTPILDKQYIPIQKADDITWTKIWNAVKLEISDTNPALKEGSKEYYEAVNDRFSDIVDRTQVVDTVMHRSDIMRQKDSGWKMLTAFMAEPTKSYNLLLNAKEKYDSDKSDENKKAMLRTTAAWMATTAVNTFIISLVDMWRRDDKDKETLLNKWIDNILNDITGMVPMVRDIYSLLQGYSIKRMEYNGIEKVTRAAGRTGDYVLEAVNGEKHKYPLRLLTKDWIESVSYVFGISTANITREIEAILKNYIRFTENDKGLANDVYEFMFKK